MYDIKALPLSNERIKEKVRDMYMEFASEVDPKNVFDLLIQRRVISIEQKLEIANKVTAKDRCRALLDHLFLCSNDESFIVLREALEDHYHWIVERIDQCETENETTKPTKCVESCVFVIGFSLGDTLWPPSKDVVKINLNRSAEVSNMTPIPAQMIIESAAAVYCDSVFVTGTGQHSDEIWRFDATFSTWTRCASLVQRRRRHSVAFVNDILYMCGGYVDKFVGLPEKTLDDVETYDVHKNICVSVGKLALAVESSGNCVPVKSLLYIFGGNGVGSKPLGKVQVYDTKLNTCTVLSQPVPIGDSFLRAVMCGNTVILVGFYGSGTYNLKTEVWQVRNKLKTGDVYYGLAIANDLVFVIGGGHPENSKWICRDDVRCVPVMSILNDEPIEWKHHAKMPSPSLVYAFGQMDLHLAKIQNTCTDNISEN